MNKSIQGDFQICISVPLKISKISQENTCVGPVLDSLKNTFLTENFGWLLLLTAGWNIGNVLKFDLYLRGSQSEMFLKSSLVSTKLLELQLRRSSILKSFNNGIENKLFHRCSLKLFEIYLKRYYDWFHLNKLKQNILLFLFKILISKLSVK